MAKTTLERGVSTRIRMPRVIIDLVNSALVIPDKMKPSKTRHKEQAIPTLKVKYSHLYNRLSLALTTFTLSFPFILADQLP